MIEVARPAPVSRNPRPNIAENKSSPTRNAQEPRKQNPLIDGELKRRVELFLSARNMPGLRRIAVDVDGATVVISGRVRTYYEKQLAAHCVQRVAGVVRVIDALEVE